MFKGTLCKRPAGGILKPKLGDGQYHDLTEPPRCSFFVSAHDAHKCAVRFPFSEVKLTKIVSLKNETEWVVSFV